MMEEFEKRTEKIDGRKIFYLLGGPIDGPPLLLLHGYPQTHICWHRVAPKLAESFRLVIPDLPGYGASEGKPIDPRHEGYSKRSMANDMAALMFQLGHEHYGIVGHDRGARVAYRQALDFPGRIDKLAVLDIVPTLDMWENMGANEALGSYHWQFLALPHPVPERLIANELDFYIEHLLERWAGDITRLDPKAISAYVEQFRNPRVLEATCEDYRAGATVDRVIDQESKDRGDRINAPVLVLWGRQYEGQTGSPAEVWQQWADEVVDVPLECGHFVAEEAPDTCYAALADFFNS